MGRPRIPEAVLSAAHERSRARAERDWPTAEARLNGALQLSKGLAKILG